MAAENAEGEVGCARDVRIREVRVSPFIDRERRGPAVLDGIAKPMQRANSRVSAPGKDELRRTAHADHLVIDEIGRHAHETQVATLLPNDFVRGCEGNEVREALEREGVSV